MRFIANKDLGKSYRRTINYFKVYSSNRELGFTILGILLFIFLALLKILINSSIFGREISPDDYYDVNVYYEYIIQIKNGSLPYIDFSIEYPVFFGITLFILSFVPYRHFWDFTIVYTFFSFILFILTQIIIFRIQKNMHLNELYSMKLIFFWNISLTSIVLLVIRYEIIPIFFTCCVFYLFQKYKKHSNENFMYLAIICTIIGFNFKWFPIFILPILIIESKKRKNQVKRIIISILFLILINLPFLLINFQGWLSTYRFHFNRLPNNDSFHNFLFQMFGSNYDILQILLVLFGIIIGLATIYNLLEVEIDLNILLTSFVFFCFLFFILNKIFSPQFLLWVLPAFIFLEWKRIFLLIPVLDFFNIMIFKTNISYELFVANILIREILLIIILVYITNKFLADLKAKKLLNQSLG